MSAQHRPKGEGWADTAAGVLADSAADSAADVLADRAADRADHTAAAEQRWIASGLAQPVEAAAWRFWAYPQAAVVLGCAQRAWLAGCGASGDLPVLARTSGGGAVLVGPWMLGLSVLLPTAHPLAAGGPMTGYRWLGQAIALSLRQLGIAAQALSPEALRQRGPPPSGAQLDWACFGSASPWEVFVGPRKLAGLAQARRRHGVLLVAGVLVQAPPWALLCARLGQAPAQAQGLEQATIDCEAALSGTAPGPGGDASRKPWQTALRTALQTTLEHRLRADLSPARPSHRDH